MRVIDPAARIIEWDAAGESYTSEVPGVVAEHGWQVTDIDADSIATGSEYELVSISSPLPGTYVFEVQAQAAGPVSFQIGGHDSNGASSYAYEEATYTSGQSRFYVVAYSPVPGDTVHVEEGSPASLEGRPTDNSRIATGLQLAVFPVPSLGKTNIEFVLPRGSRTIVDIFGVGGVRVAELESGWLEEGFHHYEWDGKTARGAAPAGTYFVRIDTSQWTESRRFVVLRR